jgi:hypothetical protein
MAAHRIYTATELVPLLRERTWTQRPPVSSA